jgi:hypothetical protein
MYLSELIRKKIKNVLISTVLRSYEKDVAGCCMGGYGLCAGSGQIQVASAFEEPAAGTIGVCIALGISGYCDS